MHCYASLKGCFFSAFFLSLSFSVFLCDFFSNFCGRSKMAPLLEHEQTSKSKHSTLPPLFLTRPGSLGLGYKKTPHLDTVSRRCVHKATNLPLVVPFSSHVPSYHPTSTSPPPLPRSIFRRLHILFSEILCPNHSPQSLLTFRALCTTYYSCNKNLRPSQPLPPPETAAFVATRWLFEHFLVSISGFSGFFFYLFFNATTTLDWIDDRRCPQSLAHLEQRVKCLRPSCPLRGWLVMERQKLLHICHGVVLTGHTQ